MRRCLVALLCCAGCGGTTIGSGSSHGGPDGGDIAFLGVLDQSRVGKIDLLFMIDNSISMLDKQKILTETVPDLARRLVNPDCVDESGRRAGDRPPNPGELCPTGVREFQPVTSLHVGVITSSLGGHGSTKTCVGADGAGLRAEMVNDHGRLVASRPRWATVISNYPGAQAIEQAGFLDWAPADGHGDLNAFNAAFQAMTEAPGEYGCGFEASLESIHRFLVDPEPYANVVTRPCSATNSNPCGFPEGIDDLLLAQRAAFLRPDSLVAIVLLSDENDCSIRNSQSYTWAAGEEYVLRQGSAQCAQNPNDPCCYSCLQASPPANCAADPSCGTQDPLVDSQVSVRCFEQKRRYGLDFLYPTARYVNALTSTQLCRSRADLDPVECDQADLFLNPLFQNASGGVPRSPARVFFAGIVGVPWQDIKAATVESPDGTLMPVPDNELRYRTARQMSQDGTWSRILGERTPPPPGSPPIPPGDTLMVESIAPRGGNGPLGAGQGESGTLQPPSAGPMANPANGHEWTNSLSDDLQYACIFPLAPGAERDCAAIRASGQVPEPGCDCFPGTEGENNPLCQDASGSYTSIQRYAKAYPGLRHLQVLRDLGNNAIVASICPRNVVNANEQDYGYRPAVDTIVDRLKEGLQGGCLPRQLPVDDMGDVPCGIVEAVPGGGACDASRGRADVPTRIVAPAQARLKQLGICGGPGQSDCDFFQLCEIVDADPSCLQNVPYSTTPGWCYIDADLGRGDPALVSRCPATERRLIRFVDPQNQTPASGAVILVSCFQLVE